MGTAAALTADTDRYGTAPARRPRPGSTAAAVYDWVLARPGGTAFYLSDVPAPPRAAARIMHDLVRGHPDVERIIKGFYCRRPPLDGPRLAWVPYGKLAMEYAGPGSGYAAATAVNRLGWTTQVPVGDDICVVGRAPQPDTPRIRFASRSNPRRLDLTWAEVTVLEGVQNFHLAESARFDEDAGQSHTGAAWDEAVEFMGDGWSAYRLGPGASIRTAAVLEAAASEPRKPEGFLDRLADLARRVPGTVAWDFDNDAAIRDPAPLPPATP